MVFEKQTEKLLEDLKVVDKLYEFIRFIDPIKKKVIVYKSNSASELDESCFDFWMKGKICDNCISMRAFNENQTFVKVEYSPKKIFMITAIPVELGNERIVVEFLKDTTNSMILGDGEDQNNFTAIYDMIDNLNLLALKDPLTGVYNRRYINEKLPIDLINAALSKQSISIIMADIDWYKKVNDTYGHLVGDDVLKKFAEMISGCITRESDWISRYGGEEFIICLPGAGIERATEIAENIRSTLEDHPFISGSHQIRLTASFGVCNMKVSEGMTVERLIECADQMLYVAKNKGKNRVETKQI